ncbi:hypothetical protein KCP75_00145 [Salmonella enterica subsp. enterica]|nr:hypothetical protein KCP75_00145 [Salmonella enterica subsp. enterica]
MMPRQRKLQRSTTITFRAGGDPGSDKPPPLTRSAAIIYRRSAAKQNPARAIKDGGADDAPRLYRGTKCSPGNRWYGYRRARTWPVGSGATYRLSSRQNRDRAMRQGISVGTRHAQVRSLENRKR